MQHPSARFTQEAKKSSANSLVGPRLEAVKDLRRADGVLWNLLSSTAKDENITSIHWLNIALYHVLLKNGLRHLLLRCLFGYGYTDTCR